MYSIWINEWGTAQGAEPSIYCSSDADDVALAHMEAGVVHSMTSAHLSTVHIMRPIWRMKPTTHTSTRTMTISDEPGY